jgi:glycosyltransferase involved in cell wall biosynthesis
MRIAMLATNVESVPPEGYGGTELVVHLLTEELIKRGHEVTLFATGDSRTSARLVSVCHKALRVDDRYGRAQWQAFDIRLLLKLEELQDQFDIVHNHMGWQALPVLNRLSCATVTTNHNPIKPYAQDIYLAYKHLPYVALSRAYQRLNCSDTLNYIGVVYNGINCDDFKNAGTQKRDFLLFIGRLGKAKGTADALEIARRLKLPMKLAGKIDDSDIEYFKEVLEPQLQSQEADFVGEVDFAQKLALYRQAKAVVYPVQFDEPFGLVMAEALASGTPVMAYKRGAVPEIVTDGETGIIGEKLEDLVSRFAEVESIDRNVCAKRARDLFDMSGMVDAYELVYKKVLTGNHCVAQR